MPKTEQAYIALESCRLARSAQVLLESVDLRLYPGQPIALTGTSGSGKSTFLQVLAGQLPLKGGKITRSVSQQEMLVLTPKHHFKSRSNIQDFYYQQRYHSQDVGQAMRVSEYYRNIQTLGDFQYWSMDKVISLLDLASLLEKPCIALSNGETRRVMLGAALLKNPRVLLLDDPLVGLDKQRQDIFESYLQAIVQSGIQLILTCAPEQIPQSFTNIWVIKDKTLQRVGSSSQEKKILQEVLSKTNPLPAININALQDLFPKRPEWAFTHVVHMENVHVRYGDKDILQEINWTVKMGESWSLAGANGAGKSTLLSLINGDNPQAYSNHIVLFDRKRGSGESIWDIKQHIGFVSPELHQYFPAGQSVGQVVCSGYFDTLGLYRACSPQQIQRAKDLTHLLLEERLWKKPFQDLSRGEQRICLLLRALAKQPALLILDEPTQGLDRQQSARILQIVDTLCKHTGTTLIYVTHQAGLLPASINHRLLLEAGRIKENTGIKHTYHEQNISG